jgi:hypothetical protein
VSDHSRLWTTNQIPNDYQQRPSIATGKQYWWCHMMEWFPLNEHEIKQYANHAKKE